MILSRVGCDKSRFVTLVLVGYGTRSAGTGDPFVDRCGLGPESPWTWEKLTGMHS